MEEVVNSELGKRPTLVQCERIMYRFERAHKMISDHEREKPSNVNELRSDVERSFLVALRKCDAVLSAERERAKRALEEDVKDMLKGGFECNDNDQS